MSRPYKVSTLLVNMALQAAMEAGIPMGEIIANTGLEPSILEDPDAWVSSRVYENMMANVARLAGNEFFWLRKGHLDILAQKNLVWVYTMNANTLRECGQRSTVTYRLLSEGALVLYLEENDAFLFRISFRLPEYNTSPHLIDWGLSQFFSMLHAFVGDSLRLKAVRLTDKNPARKAACEEFFQVPVLTGQPHNELVFPREVLDTPNAHKVPDENLDFILGRLIEPIIQKVASPPSFKEELSAVLQKQLIHGKPTLQQIAKLQGVSSRTLQRQIAAYGQTFSDLMQEIRKELAAAYLIQTELNVAEMALLLGYTETATLTTAFRRWYGMTPTEFRRKHHA